MSTEASPARRAIRTAALLGVLASAIAAAPAQADPRISAPATAKPGAMITLTVSDYPPGVRIRIQFGKWFSTPVNCCASTMQPALGQPGYLIDDTGRRTIRLRMPRAYAQCVTTQCSDPNFKRYRRGEKIYVNSSDAELKDNELYATDLLRVR